MERLDDLPTDPGATALRGFGRDRWFDDRAGTTALASCDIADTGQTISATLSAK
jgi:hypothetical protein